MTDKLVLLSLLIQATGSMPCPLHSYNSILTVHSATSYVIWLSIDGFSSGELVCQFCGVSERLSPHFADLMMCRLDIPKAPLLLGQLLGSAIDEGSLKGASLQEVCEPIEDTEARRELLAHVLKTVQASCKSMKQEGYTASAQTAFCLL